MMAKIKLTKAQTVELSAILKNGEQVKLMQRPSGEGAPSQCVFFEPFHLEDCEVQLRVDFNVLDDNEDPLLDVDIRRNGEQVREGRKLEHNTAEERQDGEWRYDWEYLGTQRAFKLLITDGKNEPESKSVSA